MTANSRGAWDVSSGLGGFHLKNTLSGHYRNWLSVGRAVLRVSKALRYRRIRIQKIKDMVNILRRN